MAPVYFFLLGVSLLVPHVSCILRQNWLSGTSFGAAGANASFDFVVVGGGTAGLTLATRLAQNGSFSVAVVEAGGFYEFEGGNVTQIPAFAPENSNSAGTLEGVNPNIDWRFLTTPQAGAAGRQLHYARGKCLGGSSARNYMEYNRATVGSMQKWADHVGDESYTWENVLPYYKKSVQFTPPNNRTIPANASIGYDPSAYSPDGGPLHVTYANYIYAFGSWARNAFLELGLAVNPTGAESGRLIGHQYTAQTYDPRDETRSSSQTSFLTLAMQETALVVYTRSFVKRVLFDANKQATGVVVEAAGVPFYLTAMKEVILSAGVFQSPQLLMVSGIGPADTLVRYDIPVLADRPGVGQNMWDNIIYGPAYELDLETAALINNPDFASQVVEEYLVQKAGPLTNVAEDYIAFGKVSNQTSGNLKSHARQALSVFPADWPEVEWIVSSSYFGTGIGPPDAKNYGSIIVGLLAMLSRGNVTIASSDMSDPPVINPNWLTDPTDQEVAVAAFKYSRAFFHTEALKPVVIGREAWPGANITTDADILGIIQATFQTLFHAAGTCAMGRTNDTMAVVDSKARVIGVEGLRVVDTSAFPLLPPGQPQATVYMIAEKIADAILLDL
ncbi:hypothetical protein LTR36_000436 [Oleoguttula mirabilis]|uniref:GMC oxidoreductase n=1 Tax=Oleoguttula mirabilis TaxID=1507867 RepID=A0AAV9JZ33_9PEZI|nr:hypothetical protein LTR36_000436 [Oleoguttula mirabilis]